MTSVNFRPLVVPLVADALLLCSNLVDEGAEHTVNSLTISRPQTVVVAALVVAGYICVAAWLVACVLLVSEPLRLFASCFVSVGRWRVSLWLSRATRQQAARA